MAVSVHKPDSISALQAIERNPCPQISDLVSYPIFRSALFTVFSDIGFQDLVSPVNTKSNLPVITWICSSRAIACGDKGTRWISPAIFVPLVEKGTPSNAGRVSGISQTPRLRSNSLQRAKRSWLERTNTCSDSKTVSRVSARPL